MQLTNVHLTPETPLFVSSASSSRASSVEGEGRIIYVQPSCCSRLVRWLTEKDLNSTFCAMTNILFPIGIVLGAICFAKAHTSHILARRILGSFSLGIGAIFTFKTLCDLRACASGGPRWQAFLSFAVLASGVASVTLP